MVAAPVPRLAEVAALPIPSRGPVTARGFDPPLCFPPQGGCASGASILPYRSPGASCPGPQHPDLLLFCFVSRFGSKAHASRSWPSARRPVGDPRSSCGNREGLRARPLVRSAARPAGICWGIGSGGSCQDLKIRFRFFGALVLVWLLSGIGSRCYGSTRKSWFTGPAKGPARAASGAQPWAGPLLNRVLSKSGANGGFCTSL